MPQTVAKTPEELRAGDRVKFGRDDFRTIIELRPMWGGRATWMYLDPTSVPAGAHTGFDVTSRRVWRVAR